MLSIITSAGSNISGWGLVGIFVMLIGFGGLIPRRQYKQVLRDKDEQLNEFRAIHAADLERANIQTQQITRLLDASETTTHLINTLQRELGPEVWGRDDPRHTTPHIRSSARPSAPNHTNGEVPALLQGGIDARGIQHLIATSADNAAELRQLREYITRLRADRRGDHGIDTEFLELGRHTHLLNGEHANHTPHWDDPDGYASEFGPLESDDH
jgi:hypothetical protein